MGRFRDEVARHIKGKAGAKRRRTTFEEKLPQVCSESRYPRELATADEDGRKRFIERKKMTARHSNGWAGADVRLNALALCRHFVEGVAGRGTLMAAVLKSKAS